ncbi:MAG: Polyphosphate glucokinase [Acidimicrobiaceae bacterium]|nr:Polyphosphate glucokinase [Acidimicrobiaceae bacterium]
MSEDEKENSVGNEGSQDELHTGDHLASDEPPGPGHGGPLEPVAKRPEDAPVIASTVHAPMAGWSREPVGPLTLGVDVGGTGIKASVLDAADRMVADRVRVATTYPLAADEMVRTIVELVKPLPSFDRASVGFPGVVRRGVVLTAPHFITAHGPGTKTVPELLHGWTSFPLAEKLEAALGKPTRIANDADLQGLAVVKGNGLEMVVTLGTGVGTALFLDGVLAPHLELAHHPFRQGETYNEQLGVEALAKVGPKKWRRRVLKALDNFNSLVNFDTCYIGGGNARRLVGHLDPSYVIVDNVAGILGAIRLWERHGEL